MMKILKALIMIPLLIITGIFIAIIDFLDDDSEQEY